MPRGGGYEPIPEGEPDESGGATGGGDDETTGWDQPGAASTPDKSGEYIPMPTRHTTMSGSPEQGGKHTAESSFTEGEYSQEHLLTEDETKIKIAYSRLKDLYPEYNKDGKFIILKIGKRGKVVAIGPQGGETALFKADNKTLNPKLPKTLMETLGQKRSLLIQQNEQQSEELRQEIAEDEQIANNENEEPAVREQAREKAREKTEQLDMLKNARERLEEGLSLKEKVKAI